MRAVTWLAERLAAAPDLAAFHGALVATGLMPPGERFMQLEIDVSNRCNIRCVMCYHSLDAFVRRPAAFLSVEAFERIADMVLPHAHTLTLALGSEPMTSPHFVPVLRAAARHHVPRLTFFTNATLVTAEIVEAILDARVTEVCVSVDGATRETYEGIRRGADFARVLRNVQRLIAARDRMSARSRHASRGLPPGAGRFCRAASTAGRISRSDISALRIPVSPTRARGRADQRRRHPPQAGDRSDVRGRRPGRVVPGPAFRFQLTFQDRDPFGRAIHSIAEADRSGTLERGIDIPLL